MADNKVTVKVGTEPDLSGVEAIENSIDRIKQEKIQLRLQAKTEQLQQAESRIEYLKKTIAGLEAVPAHLGINIDEKEIQKLKTELKTLEQKQANLKLDVEKGELEQAKAEIQAMENNPINVQLETQTAMQAIDQMGSGFDRLKQGASELKTQMGEILEASGRMENTETFLSMNIGAEQAKKKIQEIRNVTDQLPGDDVTLQNLLSQAAIKDANLGADAMRNLGSAAADYMAGMQNFGKTSLETQQDLMNYILAGNTAEVERSPILQSHIDKLKEATTVQERSKALQEALNAEGWAGIASQDTYNNKLQKFNDMLTRGKMNLGDMFREPTEQAMEFTMQLDAATGGMVGMVLATAQMAQPLTDSVMGLSQIAMGMNAIKNLGFIQWFTQLGIVTRLSTAANWAFGAAQAFVNAVMAMNPIALVVIALVALATALILAYQNVDWFREAVNNAWLAITQFAGVIWGIFKGAFDMISNTISSFTLMLGLEKDNWINSVLSFIIFIATLPAQLGVIFWNAVAKALGFGDNFVQNMANAALNAVNGFVNWISQLPGKLEEELNKMLDMAADFAMKMADKMTMGGASMVYGWINGSGEHSPGYMYEAFVGELSAMEKASSDFDLSGGMADAGSSMVSSFNPNIANSSTGVIGTNNITINIESVDNENRIQEIVEAVEEALAFDNLTAGRTV